MTLKNIFLLKYDRKLHISYNFLIYKVIVEKLIMEFFKNVHF